MSENLKTYLGRSQGNSCRMTEYRCVRLILGILLVVGLTTGPLLAARPIPRLAVWMEVSANLLTFASREQIAGVLDRARAVGVTDVIPEAKNAWGFVMYESTFAPHIRTSLVPRTRPPAYDAPATWFPSDIDPLQVVIEEAHARGIRVHAAVNVFGEGLNAAQVGVVFQRPEWMTRHLAPDGRLIPASEVGVIAFANPVNPEVQLYELAIIQEVVARYDVDGVVLDRIRFPDGFADFSEMSRAQFEEWLGGPVERWPDDVLAPNGAHIAQGPLFPMWIAWRANIIRQFVRAAERVVHGVRPNASFSAYVGGWYPTYWNEGVNWASKASTPDLPWVTPEWKEAAIGDLLDFLMPGLYFIPLTQRDAMRAGSAPWMSVEGGALMARDLLNGGAPPVGALLVSLYEHRPEHFRAALDAVLQIHGAAMLFDLVYLELYGWWDFLTVAARPSP